MTDTPPPPTPPPPPARGRRTWPAGLAALEAWRDQFLADLDAAQDEDTEEALTADPPELHPDDEILDPDRLIAWVHRHVAAVIARPLRGEVRWCPLWWEHPEAVFRFEAARRAWTHLAPEPGAGHVHLDPRPPRPLPARTALPAGPVRRLHPQRPLPPPQRAHPAAHPAHPGPHPPARRVTHPRRRRGRNGAGRPACWCSPRSPWPSPSSARSPPSSPTAADGDRAGRGRPGADPAAGPRAAAPDHRAHRHHLPRATPGVGRRPGRRRIRLEPARVQPRPQRRRRRALPAQPDQLGRRRRPALDVHPTARRRRHPRPGPAPRPRRPVRVRQPAHRHRPPRATGKTAAPLDAMPGLPHRRLLPGHRLGHRHPHRRRSRL